MKRSRIEEVSAESGIKVASDDDRSYLKGVSIMLTAPPIRQATDPKDVEAEDERDQSEFGETELCPYCGNDICPHHAASLDLTFRQVVGGELYDAIEACLESTVSRKFWSRRSYL